MFSCRKFKVVVVQGLGDVNKGTRVWTLVGFSVLVGEKLQFWCGFTKMFVYCVMVVPALLVPIVTGSIRFENRYVQRWCHMFATLKVLTHRHFVSY